MASPRILSGARAKVGIYNATTGQSQIIGSIANISYGVTYDVQPAFILGSFPAAAIEYTAADIVQITASGWRVFGHGWHIDGQLPLVQQLLFAEPIELVVIDRQQEALGGEPRVAKIRNVRPTSGSGGFVSKALSEMTHTFVGLLVDDESVTNSEHPTAASLP